MSYHHKQMWLHSSSDSRKDPEAHCHPVVPYVIWRFYFDDDDTNSRRAAPLLFQTGYAQAGGCRPGHAIQNSACVWCTGIIQPMRIGLQSVRPDTN